LKIDICIYIFLYIVDIKSIFVESLCNFAAHPETPAYSIFESNDKSIFDKKMKKNNFYKNITIYEEESEVFNNGVEIIIDEIDYTDYDYLLDLM